MSLVARKFYTDGHQNERQKLAHVTSEKAEWLNRANILARADLTEIPNST